MRLHAITTVNLNSLYGRHELDLDSGLSGAGLFLIHGPTGAGKSTLLDAICLALYGATPRLSGRTVREGVPVDGVSETNPALVLSRGAGNALAEVVFSVRTPEGERTRYRAAWSVHRARQKADGEFQTPVRRLEVWDGSGYRVLVESTKAKDVDPPFERALQGLSFDDFQRTTLLAQFAFRQFLDAKKEERANLLERMTDSGRFRELGRAAADMQRAAKAAVEAVDAELAGRRLLTPDERAERLRALTLAEEAAAALKQRQDALRRRESAWAQLRERLKAAAAARTALRDVEANALRHQPDIDALEADERAAPAARALDAWRAARAVRERAAAGFAAANSAVESAQLVHHEAEERASAFEGVRGVAAAALTAAEPVLAEANEAWQAWASAKRQDESATRDLAERQAALSQATSQRVAAEQRLGAVAEQRDEVARRLDAIPARDRVQGLSERLAEQVARLEADEALVAARQRDHAKGTTTLGALTKALAAARAAASASEQALGAQRAQAEGEARALLDAAGGEEPERAEGLLTARRDALTVHAQRLAGLSELLPERSRLVKTADERAAATAAAATELALARASADEHDRALARLDAHARTATEHLEALGKILHLVELRDVLVPGEPCPLCGSGQHPFREDPASAPDATVYREKQAAAEAERVAMVEERARVAALRDHAHQSVASLTARLAEGARDKADRDERLAGLLARIAADEAALSEAGVLSAPASPDAVATAQRGVDTEVAATSAQLETLSAARKRSRVAEERLRELERTFASRREAALSAESERKVQEAKVAALTEELGTITARVGGEHEALRAALAGVGIVEASPRAGLAQLEARARALKAAEDDRVRLDAAWQGASTEVATASERVAAAEAEVARAAAARQSAAEHLEHARAASLRYYDGQDPAMVRDRLQAALRVATTDHESAQRALTAASERRAAALATVEARRVALAEAEQAEAETRATFDVEARLLGVPEGEPGEAALVARLLPTSRRDELIALRQRLHRAAVAAQGALAEAERAEAAERAALEGSGETLFGDDRDDAGAEAAVAALAAERADLDVERTRLDQEVGALRGELVQDDAGRDERAALEAKRAALEDDREHWTAIAQLIGTNDGLAFVEVVQALNLRSVIARANDRLARFMPRYTLEQVVGDDHAPRLDFRVADACSHGMPRPVKSLSGGESFIVSLALALGLADLRSSRLRIETLLIDEGFGSLDGDTLQHVLGALSALQEASGAQIGLISHVEAMREAIPAQIRVTPSGEGRSTASFAPR